VAKKKIRAQKPNQESQQAGTNAESSTSAKIKDAEQQIKTLIEKGRKKGYLTYEETNEDLPDEGVSPARLDSLLATLDEMGINLLDEADVKKQEEEEEFEVSKEPLDDEETVSEKQLKEDELLEKRLTGAEAPHRIDDPIRIAGVVT